MTFPGRATSADLILEGTGSDRPRRRMTPLVSCIVPVYNGASYLAETLDSILAQTHRPIELIVVDDGSTDGTPAVIERYRGQVVGLRQPNAGLASARNLGVARATGEFLAFLDADDLWLPEKLARQLERFRARPELLLSVTRIQNFWAPEVADEATRYRERRYAGPLPGYCCCTLVARRAGFQRVGAFADLRMAEDADWFLRARELGVLTELLPEVLVRRRLHATNLSQRFLEQVPGALLDLARRTIRRRRAAGDGGGMEPPRS